MDQGGVLVIITSSLCGGCKAFKQFLPGVEAEARKRGIRFIHHEDKHSSGKEMYSPPSSYPALGNMGWYPFIFYTDSKTWDSIGKGLDKRGTIKILNGRFGNKGYELTVGSLPNVSAISNWLDKVGNENTVIHDNSDWTLTSKNDTLLASPGNKKESTKKLTVVPRRKYGKSR